MSSLMTSPSSSAPASAWSVNQVKKLSGSSCCLFLPDLFCVWVERLVRSYRWMKNNLQWNAYHQEISLNMQRYDIFLLPRNTFISDKYTYLSWFPFDFCWLWGWISTLVQMELFGKYFVFEVRVFIKVLYDKMHKCKTRKGYFFL